MMMSLSRLCAPAALMLALAASPALAQQGGDAADTPAPETADAAETPACPPEPENDVVAFGPPLPVAVETATGTHRFQADIARSPRQRARGMMYRPQVGPDEAMLFIFDDDQERSFFMRNTCASLDLIWVDKDFGVIGVAAEAVPFDDTQLISPGPARFVLELAGGRAAQIGLQVGDRLRFIHP